MEQAQQQETSKPGHDFEAGVNALTQVALDAVVMMDAEGRITDWNPQAEITFGWSREEAIGRLLSHTIIPLRYQEAHTRGLWRFLETGGKGTVNKRMEIEAVHRDGREFPVDLAISAVHSGGVWTFVAFVRDISARKRVVEALAEETEALYSLIDSTQDSIYFKDVAGHFTRINRAHAQALGISNPLQALGKTDADFFDPDFALAAQADEQQIMQSGTSLIGKVECVRRNGGTEIWYSTTKVVLKDSQRRVAGILGVSRDITQLNRVQKELQASNEELEQIAQELDHRVAERTRELVEREARIRRLVDANIIGVLISELEGQIIESNDAFLKMVGYSREDLVSGRICWSDLTPTEWQAVTEQAVTQIKANGACDAFEKEYVRKDGTRVPVLVGAAGFGGNSSVAFVVDLTERKRAEEAVRQSEKQLRDVIETMPVIAFTTLSDGSIDFVNRRWIEYMGLTAEKAGYYRQATVHPEDIEGHLIKWQSSLASGEPFENEVRHRGADGQYRWFLVRGVPLRDEHGKILKWFGTLTDIEDRKQAEERLRKENVVLREEIDKGFMFDEIVGASAALQGVLARIAKVAPTDSTVLITGETGTGKERIARAIHKESQRSGRPFVGVNCAAIPRDLIPSELFGHEKGAFTGAMQRRLGRFELADGGTIFLDEVGELLPDTQVALLRVLQEREFERVGGGHPIHVDLRVIAATNRDLNTAVADGTFRQDLFYRLNVFPIEVPPLRERKDDILMLVEYFVQRYASRAGKHIRSIEKKTLDLLQSYDWPGNIRELQNVIERSVILSSGDFFSVDKMWLSKETPPPASRVRASAPLKIEGEPRSEREIIEAALAATRGRVSGPSGAATKLGIPPSTLETRIKTLKINKAQYKFR
jgi:PAS domain S-box-containing protein